jgi:hypothetical protein
MSWGQGRGRREKTPAKWGFSRSNGRTKSVEKCRAQYRARSLVSENASVSALATIVPHDAVPLGVACVLKGTKIVGHCTMSMTTLDHPHMPGNQGGTTGFQKGHPRYGAGRRAPGTFPQITRELRQDHDHTSAVLTVLQGGPRPERLRTRP